MADLGLQLRRLREAAGWSLSRVARATNYSLQAIHLAETGKRPITPQLAAACDRAFGTAPLLVTLLGLEEDDDMKRRALLTTAAAAAWVTAATGPAALAEVARHGLHDAVGRPDDWDQVVADFDRRLVLDPSRQFGSALLAQVLVAREHLATRRAPHVLRASALLSLTYGLWLGNGGQLPGALGWYRTAGVLADEAGDRAAAVFVAGRSASRGVYEGMSARQARDFIGQALASQRTCPGVLEGHAAAVHLAALSGDLAGGRRHVTAMRDLAERLPDAPPAGPHQRALSFHSYLECRAGSLTDAQRAFAEAEPGLAQVPLWAADAKIYFGRALVVAGDVDAGVAMALDAVRGLPFGVRVLAVGVADVLAAVPAGYAGDGVHALRGYAAAGPAPWEMLHA